jgi:hypothetical protein
MNRRQKQILGIVFVVVILFIFLSNNKSPEVFCIQGTPVAYVPRSFWTSIMTSLNVVPATYAQLESAQNAGAEWCSAGFMNDGTCAWPRQTAKVGCGGPPIAKWCPSGEIGSMTVYGVKPAKETSDRGTYKILPFNDVKWSQYN